MKRMWIRTMIMTGFFSLTMLLLGVYSAEAQEEGVSPCSDFSLAVGQSTKQRVILRSSAMGVVREYTQTLIVEARERISVKAGEFDVFRVVFIEKVDTAGPFAWEGERARYWCSPGLRMVVKIEKYGQGIGQSFWSWELKVDPRTNRLSQK